MKIMYLKKTQKRRSIGKKCFHTENRPICFAFFCQKKARSGPIRLIFEAEYETPSNMCSLVWLQTPHGWFRTYVIESTGFPMLLSIKGLTALLPTIDFATNTMAYRCVNFSNEAFAIERRRRARRDMPPVRCKDWSTPLTASIPANDN